LDNLDAIQIAIVSLIVLAGSTVLSTVGFGIAVTASPLLLLFVDPQTVVILLNTVSVALFILVIVQTRRALPAREMLPVAIAGVLGVPVGVWVLSSISTSALRIGITVLIILMTLTFRFRLHITGARARMVGPPVGFIVAILLASLGIGGPVLVLFFLARDWTSHAIRVSLAFYFLLVQTVSVVGYVVAGLFTQERIALVLIVALPALVGFSIATQLVHHMNERRFRQGVIAVIMVSSVMVLGRELLMLQGVI
jgi:uncharacterized membrane protein YfcA